ncbi:putative dolicholphosphate-mannose synthase [Trypanosoma rangeli]|uniref:Putative dolicholphosphate-mannose synthase n=1 Tax=Trypanosoma rangeli TaxID=5698 RepID=A0A422NRQ2_TRYRA|nr:putative dolicholphosphate-mannose synthase [Trypanosoma rangeli]RNF08131.1 putative dolicholphosphate-mannose synthase [Trypanosoma rangeli]|eukprot:RNF08131.1 putative dolicholphosphate-mannose synthase [Trypanosoma rangeli]
MARLPFSTSYLRRHAHLGLTVKSLNCFESDIAIGPQPSLSSPPAPSELPQRGVYTNLRRSAYSVLRNRNTPPGVCAQNLPSPKESLPASKRNRCCCAALLYRATEQKLQPESPSLAFVRSEGDRERDDFVFALKLAAVEQPLRRLLGEAKYEALVGPALTEAQQVGLCECLSQLDGAEGEGVDKGSWVARLLLTPEEDNRVKWLHEDGDLSPVAFSRLPSFRTMYVAYHAREVHRLDMQQFEAIEARMKENGTDWSMSDAAVVYSFAMNSNELRPFFCHVVRDVLLASERDASNAMVERTPSANLRHVLGAILLLQCLRLLQHEAEKVAGHMANPPTYLFTATTRLFELATALPKTDEVTRFVDVLADSCRASVLLLAATYNVPGDSPQLPGFTLWLLKEAPSCSTCHHHFRRIVQHSQADAISLLEKSGLLSAKSTDLRVVMTLLLPLLDSSGNEEFFILVIREVLMGLEERLRRDAHSFSKDDLGFVAALGARLFDTQQRENLRPHRGTGTFDTAAREQLEELQVMDGSPWALVTFSYSRLKEILRALVRDQRRLKRQVQVQVRNIVEAVTADAHSDETRDHSPFSREGSAAAEPNVFPPTTSSAGVAEEEGRCAATATTDGDNGSSGRGGGGVGSAPSFLRLSTPASIRGRFVAFVEELIKALVDETGANQQGSRVVSDELFAFVEQHVPLPNIHDEYRRKLFLLVNVFTEGGPPGEAKANGDPADDPDEIPAELRLLVTSLPLTLSPWASVMVLREVLSESAGNNPRYTYVLNAAIDLQLPISATRSRIATALNMWRFLTSQADKLTFNEQVRMKQRCFLNLPLSYILSSYWSLLTWLALLAIIGLNVVGMDFESQYVATRLFQEFAPPDEVLPPVTEAWNKEGAEELVSTYFEDAGPGVNNVPHQQQRRSSSELFLSSASYIFLGEDDQRRPMTVVPIGSSAGQGAVQRATEELACASAVLQEFSRRLPFPFFLQLEKELPLELIVSRVAERIRRVSFNNAWFVSRVIFRTFPLGRYHTEYTLVSHTCAQANLTRRRMTFLLYINQGVTLPPQLLFRLRESVLAQKGNLVVVAHEDSLRKGGATPAVISELTASGLVRCIPYNKRWATLAVRGEPRPRAVERCGAQALSLCRDVVSKCIAESLVALQVTKEYLARSG